MGVAPEREEFTTWWKRVEGEDTSTRRLCQRAYELGGTHSFQENMRYQRNEGMMLFPKGLIELGIQAVEKLEKIQAVLAN